MSIRLERQLRMWLVLGPSLAGFPSLTGFINPFRGSLSGWPLDLASRGHGVAGPHPWYEGAAVIAGPIAMLVAKIWLPGHLLSWRSRWQTPVALVWALSAFFVVPVADIPPPHTNWPIWCACE
jgi:hypothetical protein